MNNFSDSAFIVSSLNLIMSIQTHNDPWSYGFLGAAIVWILIAIKRAIVWILIAIKRASNQ